MITLRAFPESVVSVGQRLTRSLARRKEKQRYGEYRTQRVILGIYDAMHSLPALARWRQPGRAGGRRAREGSTQLVQPTKS